MYAYLGKGCWQRKVDTSGRISLYNRNDLVARSLAKQQVWVRFDVSTGDGVIFDAAGHKVRRTLALEINTTVICQLQQHLSSAQRCTHSPTPPT